MSRWQDWHALSGDCAGFVSGDKRMYVTTGSNLIGVIVGELVSGDGVMSVILDSCLMGVFGSGMDLAMPDEQRRR